LPTLEVNGRLYFVDLRLRELRAVDNPHMRIDLRTLAGRRAVAMWRAVECRECGELSLVHRGDPAEVLECPRCGGVVVVQGRIALA